MSNVDTFRRQWLIMNFLQSQARYLKRAVSASQVYQHLSDKNVHVTLRMVQRDLKILQRAVPGVQRRHGTPAGWTVAPTDRDDEDEEN
jgi:predicted DNA-binding transcriptional regulator YafY